MMLLNTKFFVDKLLTRDELIRMTRIWLSKSNRYDITLDDYNGTDAEYTVKSENNAQKIFIGNYKEALVIQITTTSVKDNDESSGEPSESAKYMTNYILADTLDKPVMYITHEKILTELSLVSKKSFVKIPTLMKEIFWSEYGGDDNGITTEDKPYYIRRADVNLAAKIVKQECDFCNPIVYISSNFITGHYDVNPVYLAQELMGQAHIVVESSPKVAAEIKDAADGQNPYNGVVKIYIPGGQSTTLVGDHLNNKIISTVRDLLSKVGVNSKYNVAKLRQNHLFDKIKNGGQADEEFAGICEAMLGEKDCEILQLKQQIDELKKQLSSSHAKATALEDNFNTMKEDGRAGEFIELDVTERDLYPNERKDVILKLIKKEFDAMKDDANLSRSRKFDVISDVLEHNFPSETDAELIGCIRRALKDGTLDGAGIGCLQNAGFVVEKYGRQAHYRINLGGDERYGATFSATPSDKSRGSKNFVTDLSNILFGY